MRENAPPRHIEQRVRYVEARLAEEACPDRGFASSLLPDSI